MNKVIKKSVVKEIDQVIKEIWTKNIPKDFAEGYIINEDCLKMCICYHLRRKLAILLKENQLRIYTEKYFPNMKKKPDIIIAQMKDNFTENSLYESIHEENVVALLELKFVGGTAQSTVNWVKKDLRKLKYYVQKSKLDCLLYFAVIYEVDCCWLYWMDRRSTKNWATGRVTELDAGQMEGKMQFEVHPY